MAKIFAAIGRGAGTAPLSDEAIKWLHNRYSYWLDMPVASEGGKTPHDVWNERGKHFLDRLFEIGKKAAADAGGGEISASVATASAQSVETNSTCPFCIPNNPGANPPNG